MTTLNLRTAAVLLCLALMAFCVSASADSLTLTLDNSTLSVAPGGSVTFTGTLSVTGTDGTDIFIARI